MRGTIVLPYASDYRPKRFPVVTYVLMGIYLLATAFLIIIDRNGGRIRISQLLDSVGIVPNHFNFLTLLSYSFLHAGPVHLLTNLFYLWVFGAGVEDAVGRWKFILLYLAAGAVGGALQWLVTITLLPPQSSALPIIGGSAACAGLVGIFAVRYYRTHLTFVGLPFRPHVVYVVMAFLTIEIGIGLYSLLAGIPADSVAHWAHIGGFIFGLAAARMLGLDELGQNAYLTQDAAGAMDRTVPGAAIDKWQMLLAREPHNLSARAELARAWVMLGDTEQAMTHYKKSLTGMLYENHRAVAAKLYCEIRDMDRSQHFNAHKTVELHLSPSTFLISLSITELFNLANALEEQEKYAYAADAFRAVTVQAGDTPVCETSLLKVAQIYFNHLNRIEEARILLRLFQERFPNSSFLGLTRDLQRKVENRLLSDQKYISQHSRQE